MDLIAVYAAILSTFVFIWQMFVWWRSGVRLNISATPDMIIIGGTTEEENNTYISLRAANNGSSPTTITNVVLFGFSSWLNYWRRRPNYTAVVNHTARAHSLPHFLGPGQQFQSLAIQDENLENLSKRMIMTMGIATIHSRDPALSVFKPREVKNTFPIFVKEDRVKVFFWVTVVAAIVAINVVA